MGGWVGGGKGVRGREAGWEKAGREKGQERRGGTSSVSSGGSGAAWDRHRNVLMTAFSSRFGQLRVYKRGQRKGEE
jgi:hypothetical protein